MKFLMVSLITISIFLTAGCGSNENNRSQPDASAKQKKEELSKHTILYKVEDSVAATKADSLIKWAQNILSRATLTNSDCYELGEYSFGLYRLITLKTIQSKISPYGQEYLDSLEKISYEGNETIFKSLKNIEGTGKYCPIKSYASPELYKKDLASVISYLERFKMAALYGYISSNDVFKSGIRDVYSAASFAESIGYIFSRKLKFGKFSTDSAANTLFELGTTVIELSDALEGAKSDEILYSYFKNDLEKISTLLEKIRKEGLSYSQNKDELIKKLDNVSLLAKDIQERLSNAMTTVTE